MKDSEWRQWIAVTANSQYQWTADEVTRQNKRGELYFLGGESGIYMRIQPEGTLSIGTYERAIPHIGEAIFTQKEIRDYSSFDQAFQKAMELGGKKFLQDMFSRNPFQALFEAPVSPDMNMM